MKHYGLILLLLFSLGVNGWTADSAEKKASKPAKSLQSRKYAVRVSAEVQRDPAQIKLLWPQEQVLSYVLYRRAFGEQRWSAAPAAVLKGDADSFIDKKVEVGVQYEYRIDKFAQAYVGRSYICSGIELPLVEDRGAVLLLVESGVAVELQDELKRLQQDLTGDSWRVITRQVGRNDSVEKVRRLIRQVYTESKTNLKTLFLLGHIPVPYSGSINPDGHKNHLGAWPADLVYADVDGEWKDEKTHKTFKRGNQGNVPGDGKYDNNSIQPNSLELEVGRVDLADMPAFKLSEVELLRRYLKKNHRFRHGQVMALAKGLIDDNFGAFSGEAFGWGAWSNFATFFAADQIDDLDWFSTLPRMTYLWAYGCGGGSNNKANGVGFTKDFAEQGSQAVFTMLFGSYFGDWDHPDNFLRAPLAAEGNGLTCVWDGRPHWFFHSMAMGENIGYAALRTQANDFYSDYLGPDNVRLTLSGENDDSEWEPNPVHVALMGDPTLRMHVVPPPIKVSVSKSGQGNLITWQAPPGIKKIPGRDYAYIVYRGARADGPFENLSPEPIKRLSFLDESKSNSQGTAFYLIKTYSLQTSASGTYFNVSQGVLAQRAE